MSFDWHSYLTLAKTLATATTDEASLRSAVSRSYYSAFNLAASRAKANGYKNKFDGKSHADLWDYYRNPTQPGCERLALLGPRMKHRRVNADYEPDFPRLTDEVKDAIENADECVAILAKLPKEFPADEPHRWSF